LPKASDISEVNNESERKMKLPFAASSNPAGEPESPKLAQAGPAFVSPSGENIAHFIYESYFGRKSLAQRDLKHAALLGCSQVADYLTLRDGGSNVVFTPVMFNNLLAAVVKKFSNDVIPQFIDSPMFQVLVCCLIEANYFTKSEKTRQQRALDEEVVAKRSNVLVNSVWQTCYVTKMHKVEDHDASSSSDESDDEEAKKEEQSPRKEGELSFKKGEKSPKLGLKSPKKEEEKSSKMEVKSPKKGDKSPRKEEEKSPKMEVKSPKKEEESPKKEKESPKKEKESPKKEEEPKEEEESPEKEGQSPKLKNKEGDAEEKKQ